MSIKQIVATVFTVFTAVFLLISASSMVENVEKGTYHVKQAAITGEMTAHMKPGMYGQWFGDIEIWPVSETFFFTADRDTTDDKDDDLSIEVQFNDGSLAKISGTCRVVLPRNESQVLALSTEHGYKTYLGIEQKLIMPYVRKVLRRTANLMSAKESYAERRADFESWAKNQISEGIYITQEEVKEVKDLVSGEMIRKAFKVIRKDENGITMREPSPLNQLGVTLLNFEIKSFTYTKKVLEQIEQQRNAIMAVATAKANAQKAEQDALTTEAQGKANVMTAKYEKEQDKMRAVVEAEQQKEVAEVEAQKKVEVARKAKEEAEIKAQQELEVAKFAKLAAEEYKLKLIAEGQGEAEKKKLIMAADGALEKKLEAWLSAQKVWAEAHSIRPVPQVQMGESNGNSTQQFMDLINVKAAKELALDMKVKATKEVK